MIIINQLTEQLLSLSNLLQQITEEQYTYKSQYLANSSIGGHTRHVIELLQCAIKGHAGNCVDYINRERDVTLENNIEVAIEHINHLLVDMQLKDKALLLLCEDGYINTTYHRELVYNVEHIIHHLALIKVSLIEMGIEVCNENFGVGYSTIQYKNNLQKV
jgi:hypothetical protein